MCQLCRTVLIEWVFYTVAAAIKELHNDAVTFLAGMVRHYTMIAISQQAGTCLALWPAGISPVIFFSIEAKSDESLKLLVDLIFVAGVC